MITAKSTVLFMGDSITDCSRDPLGEPTPWNLQTGLGKGYVNLVDAWLTANHAQDMVRVINRGVSGRTVRDLKEAWDTEVTQLKPQWLSMMIGINDVWRQFDCPLRTEIHVGLDEYKNTLDKLLALSRPSLNGLVLVTPYIIEPNRQDPMRKTMDKYIAVIQKLAKKHSAILVDVQAAFDLVMKHRHPMELAWDRIHPGAAGHMVIAKAWLKATGYL